MARFEGGWIKLYRALGAGDIPQHGGITLSVFVRILMMANWQESRACFDGEQVTVKPGQLITGLRELSPDEDIDPYLHRVRRSLSYLESTQRIAQQVRNRGRLITVINWDTYQSQDDPGATTAQEAAQATRKLRANSAQLNEEVQEEKKEYIGLDFEELYNQYPKRDGAQRKSKGLETCRKKFNTPEAYAELLNAIKRYHVECIRGQKVNTPYVLQFATFVNGVWKEYRAPQIPAGQPVDRGLKTLDDLGGSNAAAS